MGVVFDYALDEATHTELLLLNWDIERTFSFPLAHSQLDDLLIASPWQGEGSKSRKAVLFTSTCAKIMLMMDTHIKDSACIMPFYHEQPDQVSDKSQYRDTTVTTSAPFFEWRIYFKKGGKDSSAKTQPTIVHGSICVSQRPGSYLRLISCGSWVTAADRHICSSEVPLSVLSKFLFSPSAGIWCNLPSPSVNSAKIPSHANLNKPWQVLPRNYEALCSSASDFDVI